MEKLLELEVLKRDEGFNLFNVVDERRERVGGFRSSAVDWYTFANAREFEGEGGTEDELPSIVGEGGTWFSVLVVVVSGIL